MVNARTEDLQKSVQESPKHFSKSQAVLDEDAQEVIEKTYQEINHLVNQQKLLQTQQSTMHQELIDREKNLDKRERELLERSLEVERELRDSERSKHTYEQKLQHLVERETLLTSNVNNLTKQLKSK